MAKIIAHKYIHCEPFEQSKGFCGPASLKIFLSHFDIKLTEKKLAELSKSTRKSGTEYYNMTETLKKLGGKIFEKKHAEIKDIDSIIHKRNLPVIFAWFDVDFPHYSVIINTTPKNIIFIDPSRPKKLQSLQKKQLMPIWFGFVGKNNENILWRWILTAEFKNKI